MKLVTAKVPLRAFDAAFLAEMDMKRICALVRKSDNSRNDGGKIVGGTSHHGLPLRPAVTKQVMNRSNTAWKRVETAAQDARI